MSGRRTPWAVLADLLALIRFSHTLFALPFALLAAVMAWSVPIVVVGRPPVFCWQHLAGILVCMVCARSAAMAFNRIADRHIDSRNPRTSNRHLPAGTLRLSSVVLFTLAAASGFLAGTLLFLPNRLPLYLAIPVLGFLLAYSFTKRFTVLAHFWLGAALMLAPVSVWIALRGEHLAADPADLVPVLLLGTAVLLWVAGFDIIYACQDAEFDARARLKSIPATLGVSNSLRIAAACHLGMILVLAALPFAAPQVPFGRLYAGAVVAVAGLLLYEHALVRPTDLSRVNVAFFHVNWVVSLGLLVAGAIDLLT